MTMTSFRLWDTTITLASRELHHPMWYVRVVSLSQSRHKPLPKPILYDLQVRVPRLISPRRHCPLPHHRLATTSLPRPTSPDDLSSRSAHQLRPHPRKTIRHHLHCRPISTTTLQLLPVSEVCGVQVHTTIQVLPGRLHRQMSPRQLLLLGVRSEVGRRPETEVRFTADLPVDHHPSRHRPCRLALLGHPMSCPVLVSRSQHKRPV